ncbi:MAG: hypothetical protein IH961_07585 [Chloroflexi bacterium]|nr:hypothetical protein [Chloroflexota bacterium]
MKQPREKRLAEVAAGNGTRREVLIEPTYASPPRGPWCDPLQAKENPGK